MAVWEPRYPWVAVGSNILHTLRMEGTGEEGGGCCSSPATLFVFARRPEQGYNSENDSFAKKMTRHTKHPGSRTCFFNKLCDRNTIYEGGEQIKCQNKNNERRNVRG